MAKQVKNKALFELTELMPREPLDSSPAPQIVPWVHQFIHRHPRGLATAVVSVLMGFGVTAFGIAPLAPDAAKLPQRLITELIPLGSNTSQLEALANHPVELYRSEITRSTDTVDSLFRRLGVNDISAAGFLRTDPSLRRLLDGKPGKMIKVRTDTSGSLQELIAALPAENAEQLDTHFMRVRVSRNEKGYWSSKDESVALEKQIRMGSGVIKTSLFAATDDAKLPEPVAAQLVEMFSNDVDFHQKLNKGDTFNVLFEALSADGEPVAWNQGAGRVLAAEFVNRGRNHAAMWFKEGHNKGSYFGFDGQSKNRSFLASPLEFSRVTSGFSMRLHPIHQTWRAHLGVDYAAPSGTPIRSVGEGVVEFAGWRNGYGNTVEIKHSQERTTLYGHLSQIDVAQGAHLPQGSIIGAVGATGWATGPHLHFEFRVKGEHQDPLLMAQNAESATVSTAARTQFAALAKDWRRQLQSASTIKPNGANYIE
jgi:murein DD-endopeptidase MepM/ murein hydrolase activator NlpD